MISEKYCPGCKAFHPCGPQVKEPAFSLRRKGLSGEKLSHWQANCNEANKEIFRSRGSIRVMIPPKGTSTDAEWAEAVKKALNRGLPKPIIKRIRFEYHPTD